MSGALEFLILGLLNSGEKTGYELRQFFLLAPSHIGSRSFGTIYPAIHRLVEKGYVTRRRVAQEARPDKQVLSIAPAGREAFLRWLKEPLDHEEVGTARDPFAEKFLFLGYLPPVDALAVCRAHCEQIAGAIEQISNFREEYSGTIDQFAVWNLEGAERQMKCRLDWLDEVCRRLESLIN